MHATAWDSQGWAEKKHQGKNNYLGKNNWWELNKCWNSHRAWIVSGYDQPESWAPKKGLGSFLIRRGRDNIACALCPVRTQHNSGDLQAKKRALAKNQIYWHLGPPVSRTMRNKCLLFKSPSLWYLFWWPEQMKIATTVSPVRQALLQYDSGTPMTTLPVVGSTPSSLEPDQAFRTASANRTQHKWSYATSKTRS